MKYSVFSVMMPEYNFEEAARTIKKYGYDGVEWRIDYAHMHPDYGKRGEYSYWWKVKENAPVDQIIEYAPKLRDIAKKNDLEIPSLSTYLKVSQQNLGKIKKVFEAAKIMGCPQFRVPSPDYDKTQNYNKLYEQAVKDYKDVEKLAKEYGIKVLIEIHADCITSNPALALRLAENFDPQHIGVTLDPGNMIREGMVVWKLGMEVLGPYLSHVHAKNGEWLAPGGYRENGSTIWDRPWVPMKRGMVDWEDVIQSLKAVGYDKWISIEDFSELPTEMKLKEDLQFLKSIEAKVQP